MKLPEALQRIEDEGLVDEVLIRDSKGNEIYRNHQENGRWAQESQSSQALEDSRKRVWTGGEIAKYQ